MASNLPPGCRESDIPGNRPEDAAWEKLIDDFYASLPEPEQAMMDAHQQVWSIMEKAVAHGIKAGSNRQMEIEKEVANDWRHNNRANQRTCR